MEIINVHDLTFTYKIKISREGYYLSIKYMFMTKIFKSNFCFESSVKMLFYTIYNVVSYCNLMCLVYCFSLNLVYLYEKKLSIV